MNAWCPTRTRSSAIAWADPRRERQSARTGLLAGGRVHRAPEGARRRRRGPGCTELPLAVPHALRPGLGITLTDSIDALARAAIDRYLADAPHARIAA